MNRWNPPVFSCRVVPDGDRPNVIVVGEVDLATVGDLDELLLTLRDGGARRVVLDLSEVTFIDSTGVSLVLRWSGVAQHAPWDLEVRLGPAAEDVFALCGVLPSLRVHGGDGAAAAA